MKEILLATTFKLKDSHLEAIEKTYLKRLTFPKISIHEVKNEEKLCELAKGSYFICLCEGGEQFNSVDFSNWLYPLWESHKKIVFAISSAEGFNKATLEQANLTLSLSPLTYPHKLARIILLEQLYRAQSIYQNHPYHNE